MIKNLIYVTNNCYKNSFLTFVMKWALWEIDSFKIFDLQGTHFLLGVFVLKVGVREYRNNSEITREIYQD